MLGRLRHVRLWDRQLPIWYDAEYRLPLTAFGKRTGLEPRRADLVAWYLLEWRWIARDNLRTPARVRYQDLARVHGEEYLESLTQRETLAQIFGVDPWDVPVDELMRTVRLGCGGTLAAAREALRRHGAAVNLMGGFHHAGPAHGSGLCAVNDIAVAVRALREDGFDGQVAILDLDAHPPDGTAACLRADPRVWIGSLSGSSSGSIAGVDETVLPPRAGDESYLLALDALVLRMPRPDFAVVLAGGDVLDGDHLGHLGLSLDGARQRDLRVARALLGIPSVWLPGGGYHDDAWKVLTGTLIALLRHSRRPIRPGSDPMAARYMRLAKHLSGEGIVRRVAEIDLSDVEADLGLKPGPKTLLLGAYTSESVEFALYRFGLLAFLERRGYGQFRVEFGTATTGGERVAVFGRAEGIEHLLIDGVIERTTVGGEEMLYVHWLSLRDPRARFSERRPKLPGQEVPGLGLAREVTELLVMLAARLGLAGLAYNPAWFHTAYVARGGFRFLDPAAQGRFEALERDLGHLSLALVSQALAEGRVLMNGEPFEWKAELMVYRAAGPPDDRGAVEAERDRVAFTLAGETGGGRDGDPPATPGV